MTTPGDLLAAVRDVGADHKRGGYSRHMFDAADVQLREWFTEQALRRGLRVTGDNNGNLWAWWGEPGPNAVVTGSHLDSVPGGGAFDGPLGVVSALAAIDSLKADGFIPVHPLAVVVFAEEEGGRFGVPCLGSRLLTGTIDPENARGLRDQDGTTMDAAAHAFGLVPERMGRSDAALRNIGCFVELHVEQGRGLVDLDRPIAVASSIFAHGRWRLRFSGQGNHAGATRIADRRDPMLPAARFIAATRGVALRTADARVTVGRLIPNPGGTNVISSTVELWMDARAPTDASTSRIVADLTRIGREVAAEEGCKLEVHAESYGQAVGFDTALRDELASLLDDAPLLSTGAGHDAGVLAARVPTAMLFVRNPTGVSHAPEEYAENEDCDSGARALARVLRHLSGGGGPVDERVLV